MKPQSRLCRAALLLLAFATSVIQGKVRVLDNKGMKVFVLDEGAYSNLQYFLDELDAKRTQLYSAFPGSPKSAFRNENLVELEDRLPVVIGIPKRSSPSSGAGEEISLVPESGAGDQQQQTSEQQLLTRKSDEWPRMSAGPSYSSSVPAHATGHQQSSYYSMIQPEDSPAVPSASSDSQSYHEPDRYSDYSADLRSESTTSVKQESPIRNFIRRWSRN